MQLNNKTVNHLQCFHIGFNVPKQEALKLMAEIQVKYSKQIKACGYHGRKTYSPDYPTQF